KGRNLAAAAYQEAKTTGQSFALYRWQSPEAAGRRELHYAYFIYFEPWDWVFAITGNAQAVAEQFDQRRHEMERAIRESLASLTLAESGFAFIAADDGKMVSPLPAGQEGLLDAEDAIQG